MGLPCVLKTSVMIHQMVCFNGFLCRARGICHLISDSKPPQSVSLFYKECGPMSFLYGWDKYASLVLLYAFPRATTEYRKLELHKCNLIESVGHMWVTTRLVCIVQHYHSLLVFSCRSMKLSTSSNIVDTSCLFFCAILLI